MYEFPFTFCSKEWLPEKKHIFFPLEYNNITERQQLKNKHVSFWNMSLRMDLVLWIVNITLEKYMMLINNSLLSYNLLL